MTDAARATVWQASWKPWGEIENISGTILNNLRFPGQYFQIETAAGLQPPPPLRRSDGPLHPTRPARLRGRPECLSICDELAVHERPDPTGQAHTHFYSSHPGATKYFTWSKRQDQIYLLVQFQILVRALVHHHQEIAIPINTGISKTKLMELARGNARAKEIWIAVLY